PALVQSPFDVPICKAVPTQPQRPLCLVILLCLYRAHPADHRCCSFQWLAKQNLVFQPLLHNVHLAHLFSLTCSTSSLFSIFRHVGPHLSPRSSIQVWPPR